jgi:hypothetical protein
MRNSLLETLKYLWEAWKVVARKIGTFQARVLLTVLYAVLVFPFGVIVRAFSDPLRIKKRPTAWLDHPDQPSNLEWARKQ